MSLRVILLFFGCLGCVSCGKNVKEDQRNEFWGDLIFHSNVRGDRFVSTSGNRRHSEPSVPQVLMTKCPLNSRCVRRNFCDENGLMTTNRNNKLTFAEDKRGLIACVDAARNRLGVCCIDKFRVINGRRRVRQDDVLKVSEDGVVTLDTVPGGLDDGLQDEEDYALEEEFTILDTLSDTLDKEETDTRKDTTILLKDEDIESIVQSVKAEDGKTPLIMVTDQEDAEENISVRFLQPGQVAGVPGGPIVVINIHADSLGLGGRDGAFDISDIRKKLLEKTRSEPVEFEETIPVTLDENITEDEPEEETKDEMDIPDYLDFDTDYITITMETDYQDGSSFRGDYGGNAFRRQHARRPGVVGSLRSRRPNRRPSRPRRPVFRFRANRK
eukprot:TRINITY_DN17443_c0_g1_i1.p1 TRINITY_DN17443_c0_g1~~TRINITY_DN17443_c0_g1_i1.p1  ORF type:complete len:385 (+),score=93.62 TRINITY_DN17443_c0_g1_i1:53-1207(+)